MQFNILTFSKEGFVWECRRVFTCFFPEKKAFTGTPRLGWGEKNSGKPSSGLISVSMIWKWKTAFSSTEERYSSLSFGSSYSPNEKFGISD